MKAWPRLLVCVLLLVAAGAVQAGITGTAHDFTVYWVTDEACKACHVPHNARTDTGGPLWNHAPTNATFAIYGSPTMNATSGQPSSVSKLCLSCHDGTVGLSDFGGGISGGYRLGPGNPAYISTDLSDDHPVSFTYDGALATADGGLVTPATAKEVVAGIPLYGGKLECSTCHNVHDNALGKFLRASNAASALCLKCHSNK